MISDQKRSEVAENLRNLTVGRYIQYKEQFFDELAEVVVGFEDYYDFNVVLEKLADLIDRGTCRNEDGSSRSFFCSACGYEAWTYDDSCCDPSDFLFCPNCSREVTAK